MKTVKSLAVCTLAVVAVAWATEWRNPRESVEVSISGRISGLSGNDHVVIKALGSQTYRTTSRASGMWSITDIDEGVYVITPIHERYSFEPENMTVWVVSESVDSLDFTATPSGPGRPASTWHSPAKTEWVLLRSLERLLDPGSLFIANKRFIPRFWVERLNVWEYGGV